MKSKTERQWGHGRKAGPVAGSLTGLMSENDISDDDQSNVPFATLSPEPAPALQMSARSIIATILVMTLVVAFGAGLLWSRRDKTSPASKVLTGSGLTAGSIAAVVDGMKISAKDLDAVIAPWTANKEFVAAMAQGNTPIVDAKGNALPAYRAERLDALIQQSIFDDAFEKAGLKVSDSFVNELRKQVTGDPSAKGFSKEFLDDFVSARGRFEALRKSQSKEITEEQIEAAYNAQYGCESAKSVAHVLVKTEAEANAALQRIQGGETFAAVAQAVSIDQGSKAKGGDLGCLVPGTFVPEFEQAALASVVDTPTSPVKSEFGFHVIKTTAFVAPRLAEVRAEILVQLQQQDTSGNRALGKLIEEAEVSIDPFIGSWGPTQRGIPGVIAKGTPATPGTPGAPPNGVTPTSAPTRPTFPEIQNERPSKPSK